MTVKEILKTPILYLQKSEILGTTIYDSESTTEPTEEQTNDMEILEKCFNFIYQEIASNYLPLLKEEEIEFSNEKFELASLTQTILEIYKLTSLNGNHLVYELLPSYIKAFVKNAKIVYSYVPEELGLEDEVNLFSGRLIPQVLAYGVLREYSLINEDFSTADIYEKKFKDGVFKAMTQKSSIRIKPRKWK